MRMRSAIDSSLQKDLTIPEPRKLDLRAERPMKLINSSDLIGYLLLGIGLMGLFVAAMLFSIIPSLLTVNAFFKALLLGSCVGFELIGSIILFKQKPKRRR